MIERENIKQNAQGAEMRNKRFDDRKKEGIIIWNYKCNNF